MTKPFDTRHPPSALAEHRAHMLHDVLVKGQHYRDLLREATREYDAQLQREKQARPKGRDGRARGKAINVPRSRRRAA